MTEKKKEYIADALSEILDEFVAEAVEYKKPKFVWKYIKELATVAACVAVLFVSVGVIRVIPIGHPDKVSNEAAGAMQETIVMESYADNAADTSEIIPENLYKPVGEEEKQSELYSKGIEWREVTPAEKDVTNDVCGYPTIESMQVSSCLKWMSAEEILALDIDVFMGTVTDMQTYHVTGGMEKYFTVATVEIEDSIRSKMAEGDTCRIYLPFAKMGDLITTTSILGDLEELEIGSRAIFMPRKSTEEIGAGSGETWLSYMDFSDYFFEEGMRFLFLETESGISYATDVYEVPGGNTAGLEEIAAYLRDMISK